MDPLLLTLLGGAFLLNRSVSRLNRSKPTGETTDDILKDTSLNPKIRPPTSEENERGFYFLNCADVETSILLKELIILDYDKALTYAYDVGTELVYVYDNNNKILFENHNPDDILFYGCTLFFDEDQKMYPSKKLNFKQELDLDFKIQFLVDIIRSFWLGVFESGGIASFNQYKSYLEYISTIKQNFIKRFPNSKIKYLDFSVPKGYYFDIDCKMVIEAEQDAYLYFYNIGANVQIADLSFIDFLLFDNCIFIESKIDIKTMLNMSIDDIEFLYLAIRCFYGGKIAYLKSENIPFMPAYVLYKQKISHIKKLIQEHVGFPEIAEWSTEPEEL